MVVRLLVVALAGRSRGGKGAAAGCDAGIVWAGTGRRAVGDVEVQFGPARVGAVVQCVAEGAATDRSSTGCYPVGESADRTASTT